MSISKTTFLLSIVAFFSIVKINAQLSQKHFIPPLTYADEGSSRPNDQYIYISTPSSQNVSYTITQVGSNDDITGVVSKDTPQEITIGNGPSQLFVAPNQTSNVHNDKGYIVEATGGQIYVSIRVRAGGNNSQAGALVSKGSAALGTVFRAGMFTNENPQSNYLNFISVMATEDNTLVNFSDLPTGIAIENFNGGANIPDITLNEGESYIVATNANTNTTNRDGLIGTLIQSNKNIVVNSGSANGSFGTGGARDYGLDQIVDFSKVGTEYIFVRGSGTDQWENVLIVAHEDDTEIRVENNAIDIINSGEFRVIEGDLYSNNDNMYVETSKPVFAYQGIGGLGNNGQPSEANQGMFFVPPLSCESRGNVDNIAQIDRIGGGTFTGGVTIVANSDATILINGNPINTFNPIGPNTVTGNADYVTYKVTGLTGNISVESSEELYCAYFNQNGAATSGSFYSGFLTAPEINFNTSVMALGNCIPNVTLEASNTTLFDSFKWEYFNEITGIWETRSTANAYTPIETEPGRYRLVGNIICNPGEDFISTEIPVSICPDDYDGDLIIDNLDVDLDNDGILNCDESIGDANVNLTNINAPVIIFTDNTTNNTTTSIFTASESTNNFTGDNLGNFQSVITPVTDSNLSYQLNFAQNVNIKFSQNTANNHTISEGEYFIVKIGPNNKNITLLDPDDQLLVDTNFDNEFENNITQISASEIRFQYKENLNGADATFQFVANQVDEFNFEHQSVNLTASSTFNGNVKLTCFSLDSDGDGIENMLDLDSDNDGIPDIIEASGLEIILVGTDTNLDGLDDVFTTTNNLDSDVDGIPNYIDIDADNDGIFDTTEAGHNLDLNFDGFIDNANSLVGANGLVDNLETNPDAKVLSLNYVVRNTDGDLEPDFTELDADNDNCFDTNEAGFTDANDDGILDSTVFTVDANGKVLNNSDGYTNPNSNYTTSAPINITTPFTDVIFCEDGTDSIEIETTADGFQWEVSLDNGATFNTITNNATYNGATTNSLQITNTPIAFNNQQYRVVLNRTGNSCPFTSNAITLFINQKPVVASEVDLLQCDNDLDQISTINLTQAENFISTDAANQDFEYFETETQAIAGNDVISDPLRYPVDTAGEAWVRTISNAGCFAISKIILQVDASDDVEYNREFAGVCDDFLQADGTDGPLNNDTDGITNFDFSESRNEILNFFPATLRPSLTVSYFETQEDRTTVINAITDISNYRNTNFPSNNVRQTIFFKITNINNNACSGTGELFLRTIPVPMATTVSNLELCDDNEDGMNTNGIVQNFNLENQTTAILGTQDAADFTVTYHLTATDANTGKASIASPFENTVANSQEIFVRVTNNVTGCYTSQTSFNVIVNPVPVANFVSDLEVCDDNSDGSARNGFSKSIDLESQTTTILGNQDLSNHTVTYHRSLADAQSGNLPLMSPYTNLAPNRETIFVRIVNNTTGCANGISNFDVLVNPEPTFNPVSNLSFCDDAIDGDDANGIIQNIDLDSQIPALLGNAQDPDDFIVTFHNSPANASSGADAILSPYTNTLSTETIFVRIQNKATFCVNDDATFDVIVNPLPDFSVTSPQIVCLNNTPLTISAENPGEIYTYEWTDMAGNVVGDSQTLDVVVGGNYTVTATTTNGTNCSRTEIISVNESNPAILLPEFVTVVDEGNNIGSENNLSVNIDVINNNLGIGDYQFALRNDDDNTTTLFQDEPIFENLAGGIYTIIVNDKNGCSPDTTLQISVLQFPKFFTPNGDGVNDTWVVKGANKAFYPNSSINIFNRFGKLVAQIPLESGGWNGTFNGKLLSSDDYWYNITLIPADTSKPTIHKKGNFSLLRR
ncbi:T9SS type B sorting domain-containing protein [uncultured Polaribacter sp.]|uniref:T9SS type B sorting domain-containing protein n=1 Tax=uncultured Polaribacter sp. TaxID=174711 RepID=UPI0026260EF8|nr:T9SS type B sorting domain-containing protein [uncultured Polaribacter sp.]